LNPKNSPLTRCKIIDEQSKDVVGEIDEISGMMVGNDLRDHCADSQSPDVNCLSASPQFAFGHEVVRGGDVRRVVGVRDNRTGAPLERPSVGEGRQRRIRMQCPTRHDARIVLDCALDEVFDVILLLYLYSTITR